MKGVNSHPILTSTTIELTIKTWLIWITMSCCSILKFMVWMKGVSLHPPLMLLVLSIVGQLLKISDKLCLVSTNVLPACCGFDIT